MHLSHDELDNESLQWNKENKQFAVFIRNDQIDAANSFLTFTTAAQAQLLSST